MSKRTSKKSKNVEKTTRVERRKGVGLDSLPLELVQEIHSYLPERMVPYERNILQPLEVHHPGQERINFLRALSQANRTLRAFCMPLLWERIEVCTSKHIINSCWESTVKSAWEKELATELIQQLETVTIRDPSLASHIKIVNVMVTRFSMKAVLEELAHCLEMFPNLHTIQILGDAGPAKHFDIAFEGKLYPSVRTIQTPEEASAIIKCCPQARRLSLPSHGDETLSLSFWNNARFLPTNMEISGGYLDVREVRAFVNFFPLSKVMNISQPGAWDAPKKPPEHRVGGVAGDLLTLKDLECVRIYCHSDSSSRPWYMEDCDLVTDVLTHPGRLPRKGAHKCIIHVSGWRQNMARHTVVAGECSRDEDCVYFHRSVEVSTLR